MTRWIKYINCNYYNIFIIHYNSHRHYGCIKKHFVSIFVKIYVTELNAAFIY